MISYCDEAVVEKEREPKNYWSNISGTDAVRHFIKRLGNGVMSGEMEALIAGETVQKKIYEDLTYNRLYNKMDYIWSMLFMIGYLTQRGRLDRSICLLAIPNMEIRSIFTEQIMDMFQENVEKDGVLLEKFCNAIKDRNAQEVGNLFESYLRKTISIQDTFARRSTKENFYHGILLGILGYKNDWYLKSNKESGNGYSDLSIFIEDDIGIIIEVKYAQERNYETVCREAIKQINQNG